MAIPRPDIRVPIWTRNLAPDHLDRLLIAFRTLLCAESMFVSTHVEVPPQEGDRRPRTIDLVISSVDSDEHGLPVLPDPGSETWNDTAAVLLTSAWFSHTQHSAELVETALLELRAGRLTASAVTCRTAMEMAARMQTGLELLEQAGTDGERHDQLNWLARSDGRESGQSTPITKRMHKLTEVALGYLGSLEPNGHQLDKLYKRVCDASHPSRRNRTIYLGKRDSLVHFAPPGPPLASKEQVRRTARDILDGITAVTAGLLACWSRVDALLARFRPEGPEPGNPYTYASPSGADLAAAYPEVDLNNSLAQPLHQMLRYTIYNDDQLPVNAPFHVARFIDRWLAGVSWSPEATEHSELQAWTGVRLWICSELLQALVESLNRGKCATAAALGRFLLEHMAAFDGTVRPDGQVQQCRRLRDDEDRRIAEDWIEHLLQRTGMARHGQVQDQDASAAGVIQKAANGLVHADFSARSIYWARYRSTNDPGVVRIPSRPMFPLSTQGMDISDPWVIAGSTVLFAESVLTAAVITGL